jgi:hypothetical protein
MLLATDNFQDIKLKDKPSKRQRIKAADAKETLSSEWISKQRQYIKEGQTRHTLGANTILLRAKVKKKVLSDKTKLSIKDSMYAWARKVSKKVKENATKTKVPIEYASLEFLGATVRICQDPLGGH